MQIVIPPDLPDFSASVVALGNFDGIHLGHACLIRRAVEAARSNSSMAMVWTFCPHPQALLTGEPFVWLLSKEEREAKLAALGIEVLVYWPFTPSLANTSPEEFVREILVNSLHVRTVAVGFNFTFGFKASGTPDLLARIGREYGFTVVVEPPVTVDGMVVSSTAIRAAFNQGDMPLARKFLGYWPGVQGEVVRGYQRGAGLLGFATANLAPQADVVWPTPGVYAAYAEIDGIDGARRWPAVVNIGYKPTFGDDLPRTLEVHLLDYRGGDLYGQRIRVEFRQMLRVEKKFNHPEELRAQIGIDVEQALELLAQESEGL